MNLPLLDEKTIRNDTSSCIRSRNREGKKKEQCIYSFKSRGGQYEQILYWHKKKKLRPSTITLEKKQKEKKENWHKL